MTRRPTLLRVEDPRDTGRTARCPVCSRFLPAFHGEDEIVCSSCDSIFERS